MKKSNNNHKSPKNRIKKVDKKIYPYGLYSFQMKIMVADH